MHTAIVSAQSISNPEQTSVLTSDRAKVTPKLPHLWVTNIIAAQPLVALGTFAGVFSPETPPTDAVGQHILCLDPDTPELIWKAIAYELINQGCQVSVCQLGVTNYQPLEWYLAEVPVPEVAVHIITQEIDWKDWVKGLGSPLDLEDALNLAKLAFSKIQDNKKRTIELDRLRRRCNVSSYDWNQYIRNLEAEIHAAVDTKTAADADERLKLELKSLLKESDKIKYIRKRAEIASHYRLTKDEIKEALRDLDEHSKTKEPRCIGLDELFSLPNTTVEYVIPGMLPAGETIILSASPKTGKSLLAYDAAFAVATGEDNFLGETVKQGKVLIIQCDESPNTAKARLSKRGFRPEDAPNVKFMDSFNISQLDRLEERLESFRPSLVIIDCLRRISSSRTISENSAEFADSVYQLKELIARYNAAGILIHHSNKNPEAVGVDRVRGSSAIAGAVWGVWQLDHILKPDPNNKKRMIIDPKDPTRILSIIARDIEGERLRIELDPNKNRWTNLGQEGSDENQVQEQKTHEQRILDLLKSVAPTGLEGVEIKEELGLGKEVYGYLNRLLGKRLIGTRPSTRDRRSTVYFYPQAEIDRKNGSQGGGSGVNQLEDTPPSLPPTLTVSNAIHSAESHTQQELQDGSQNGSQMDRESLEAHNSQKESLCNSTPVTSLDVSMTAPKNGNGLNPSKFSDAPSPAVKSPSSPSMTQSSQTKVTTGSSPTAKAPSQPQNLSSLNDKATLIDHKQINQCQGEIEGILWNDDFTASAKKKKLAQTRRKQGQSIYEAAVERLSTGDRTDLENLRRQK
jgi:hypothetical protein